MRLYEPPKLFNPPKGVSSDGLFLLGPSVWLSNITKKLKGVVGLNVLKGASESILWNLGAVSQSDVIAVYLKSKEQGLDVLSYLTSPGWMRFGPEVYVYVTEKYHLREEVVFLQENTKNFFKIVDSAKELDKMIVQSFDYLKK